MICPSCGTEFGYTDATTTHQQLRARWEAGGRRWHSRVMAAPTDPMVFRQVMTFARRDFVFNVSVSSLGSTGTTKIPAPAEDTERP